MGDSRSGGGIVRGGSGGNVGEQDMRAFRRRWTCGVAVVTIVTDGGLRGATVSGLLPLSVDPPSIAFALQDGSRFLSMLDVGTKIGVSVLDRAQEFTAERFAGRAPVPDGEFGGIGHRRDNAVAWLDGAMAWALGQVDRLQIEGDHVLVVASISEIEIPADTDDPMVVYDARYLSLEMS